MRTNPLGIPMIATSLRDKLFPSSTEPSNITIKRAKERLAYFDLKDAVIDPIEEVNLELPDFEGNNIQEHFEKISKSLCEPWLSLAKQLAESEIPPMPEFWLQNVGWTRYEEGKTPESVPHPLEPVTVFDCEVSVRTGYYPVMACAVSNCAWYFWVGSLLFRGSNTSLIPYGNSYGLVIGHNVSYDRARILESYSWQTSNLRFFDTMSMHIAVGGLTAKQKNHYLKVQKDRRELGEDNVEFVPEWVDISTTNSLKNVSQLYLGEELAKSDRDFFVKGSLEEIRNNFQSLARYNAGDVLATARIFQILWHKFRRSCPHDATFYGMLSMGNAYIPTDDSWNTFVSQAASTYNRQQKEINEVLIKLVEKAVAEYGMGKEDPETNPWLRHLDWELPSPRSKVWKDKPQWVRDLRNSSTNKVYITPSTRVTPYLLNLTWFGFPLYYLAELLPECAKKRYYAWGYLVPVDSDYSSKAEPIELDDNFEIVRDNRTLTAYLYYRLPHSEGEKKTVNNPLAKDFLKAMESGILASAYPEAQEVLEGAISCSYWQSTQSRINSQFCHTVSPELKAILPQIAVAGTVTRRAVEPLWLTASNPKPNRIGSEIKTTMRLPKGYIRMGADVDSEELVLSDLLGDAYVGIIGGTPSGFQTLVGSKEEGTDMHTLTANLLETNRDNAKIANYCVPLYTEALTKQGWKYPEQLKVGEEILAYDSQRKVQVWTPIEEINFFDDAPTIYINGNNFFSFVTTPNHQWFGYKVQGKIDKSKPEVKFATEEINSCRSITNAAPSDIPNTLDIKREEVEIITYLFEQGFTGVKPGISSFLTINHTLFPTTARRVYQLLEDTGFEFRSFSRMSTKHEYLYYRWHLTIDFLFPLFLKAGIDPHRPNLVPFILQIGSENVKTFLDIILTREDGTRRKRVWKKEGHFLEAIRLAGVLYGYKTNYEFKDISSQKKQTKRYSVYFNENTQSHSYTLEFSPDQTQKVWCPTTKYGSWVMRQNGKVSITGNSRRYGAGISAQSTYVAGWRKDLTFSQAKAVATNMMAKTKGKRVKGEWVGGTESILFNQLERIAKSRDPRSLGLNCKISEALTPRVTGRDYMTSKINWSVQTSGVDFLHLLITGFAYICSQYDIWYKFLISVHDEIHYAIKQEESARAGLAFSIAHLWAWTYFFSQAGFSDLPAGVAFFSEVDYDYTWRKTPLSDCITPSNPQPLKPGQVRTIYEIIKATGGKLDAK